MSDDFGCATGEAIESEFRPKISIESIEISSAIRSKSVKENTILFLINEEQIPRKI